MIDSIVKVARGIFRIQGDSDNTLIGNFNDRLKISDTARLEDVIIIHSSHLESSGDKEASVNGSSTPVDFSDGPPAGKIWYVYEIGLSLVESGTLAADGFGGGASLGDPGLEFFVSINSSETRITRIQDNQDILNEFPHSPIIATGSAGFSENRFGGHQIWRYATKLVGDNGDKIIMRVNNDLTFLTSMRSRIGFYEVIS